jgi:hypothetical protein
VEGTDVPGALHQSPAPGWLPAALVTNIVIVIVAGLVAVALLVIALTQAV